MDRRAAGLAGQETPALDDLSGRRAERVDQLARHDGSIHTQDALHIGGTVATGGHGGWLRRSGVRSPRYYARHFRRHPPRQAWGPPTSPGGTPHTITRMTIHHSAVALPDNSDIVARLQQHQRYHQDDKGWVDIAYHYAVDRNGNIFELRDTAIAGDTATNYDTAGHFLVLCEGDFDQETVSEAQLQRCGAYLRLGHKRSGITTKHPGQPGSHPGHVLPRCGA